MNGGQLGGVNCASKELRIERRLRTRPLDQPRKLLLLGVANIVALGELQQERQHRATVLRDRAYVSVAARRCQRMRKPPTPVLLAKAPRRNRRQNVKVNGVDDPAAQRDVFGERRHEHAGLRKASLRCVRLANGDIDVSIHVEESLREVRRILLQPSVDAFPLAQPHPRTAAQRFEVHEDTSGLGAIVLREPAAKRTEKRERLARVSLIDEAAALDSHGGELERRGPGTLYPGEHGVNPCEVDRYVLALLELALAQPDLCNAHAHAPQRLACNPAYRTGGRIVGRDPRTQVASAVENAWQAACNREHKLGVVAPAHLGQRRNGSDDACRLPMGKRNVKIGQVGLGKATLLGRALRRLCVVFECVVPALRPCDAHGHGLQHGHDAHEARRRENNILWQLVVVVLKLVVAAACRVEACVLVEDGEHAAVILEP